MSRRRKSKGKSKEKAKAVGRVAWPEVLGQSALIAVVLATPLVINKDSANLCDVKDVVLGLGVALGLSMWLVAGLARGRLSWAASRLNAVVFAFFLWAGISVAHARYWYASMAEFARLAGHIGLFWLAICCLRSVGQVRRIVGAACVTLVPVCIYGFMQAAGRDFISWKVPTPRVFSFIGNPTYLAGYLVLLIPLAVAAALPSSKRSEQGETPRSRWKAVVASVLFLAVVPPALGCLYFSVTLAPTIGLGLGALVALVLMLVRGGRAAARVVVPLVLGLAVLISPVAWVGYRRLPPQQQARIQQVIHLQDPVAGERSLHWRVALDIFRDRPVIGNGYGSFRIYSLERMASEWYQQARGRATDMLVPGYAHNEYLQVLAGLGIIGGAILLVLLLLGYGLAVLVALRQPRDAWAYLAIGIAAASTAFLFQNFFGVTFRQTGVVTFFWLWLAILVVAAAWPMERELESSGPRLRELRFRPVPLASLTALTLVLGAALLALGWLAIRPVKSSLLLRRAQAAAAQGYFSDAVRIAEETLELNPYSAVAYYTLAYAHGQMGNIEQAVEANQKALTLLPGNASVYYNLGVSYKKLGRLEEAEEALRTAIELQPTGVENRGAMAEVLLEQKKFEEAEEHADEAVRLDPKNPKCYLLVADVAAKQGNLPKVLENLRLAARFAKDDPAVHQQLAELLLRLRQDKEAYGASLNWVKLAPHSARANAAVGTAAFNLGRYRQARSSFERALEIDPKDLKARLGLAYSAGRLRDQATAKRELERIVRTSPNSWEGREAKRVLDSVAANQARIRAR